MRSGIKPLASILVAFSELSRERRFNYKSLSLASISDFKLSESGKDTVVVAVNDS